jgi:hypothetical protein
MVGAVSYRWSSYVHGLMYKELGDDQGLAKGLVPCNLRGNNLKAVDIRRPKYSSMGYFSNVEE